MTLLMGQTYENHMVTSQECKMGVIRLIIDYKISFGPIFEDGRHFVTQ